MRRGDGIKLWASPGTLLERNEMVRTSDLVVWYSANVILRGNVARDSRYGIHFMYSSDSVLEGNRLTDNRVGAFLMNSKRLVVRNNLFARNRGPSGYGMGLKDIDGLTVEGNRFVANRVGIYIANSPNDLDVTHEIRANIIAYNDVGIAFLPDVRSNVFTGNGFVENGQQAVVLGGGGFRGNSFVKAGRGNYWSDYVGWDAGRDGVGDVPYRMSSLFGVWMERDPRLRLFNGGLAAWTIDFAARTFPAFRPETRVVDAAPLTATPRVPAGPVAPARRASPLVPVAVLSLACLVAALARPEQGVAA
jgi:nitrous oxidase accessory protein